MKETVQYHMNKPLIAVIGDIHFSHSGHSHEKFAQQMRFFDEQFFPYLLKHNIKDVFQLGDLFHDRNRVDWFILNELKRRFFKWFDDNSVQLHLLCGNHDTIFKNTLEHNSLTETTQEFKNITVYTEPTIINCQTYKIGVNPWIIDKKNPNITAKADIILGHFNITGLPMMKGITSKDGIDIKAFKKYKLVLSGHFHIRSITDNFHMLGTPMQLTWNDFNQDKGFMVLDDKFNYEYIQNEINPQFVKLYYDNGDISVIGLDHTEIPCSLSKEESLEVVKHNYCRLFTRAVDDPLKVEAYHSSLLLVSCDNYKIDIVNLKDVVEDFDASEFDDSFEDGESTIQMIMACITGMTFEEGIDKDLLVEMSKQEYKYAHDEALSIGEDE
jgi:hypothetical protein